MNDVVVPEKQLKPELDLDIRITTNTTDSNTFSGGTGTVATCATDATCNNEDSC